MPHIHRTNRQNLRGIPMPFSKAIDELCKIVGIDRTDIITAIIRDGMIETKQYIYSLERI